MCFYNYCTKPYCKHKPLLIFIIFWIICAYSHYKCHEYLSQIHLLYVQVKIDSLACLLLVLLRIICSLCTLVQYVLKVETVSIQCSNQTVLYYTIVQQHPVNVFQIEIIYHRKLIHQNSERNCVFARRLRKFRITWCTFGILTSCLRIARVTRVTKILKNSRAFSYFYL